MLPQAVLGYRISYWFQFVHTLFIECRNVNSPCIILTEYGYGGSYVGGTGAGQVPPPLRLVSGLPGPNPPIAAPNVSLNKNIDY